MKNLPAVTGRSLTPESSNIRCSATCASLWRDDRLFMLTYTSARPSYVGKHNWGSLFFSGERQASWHGLFAMCLVPRASTFLSHLAASVTEEGLGSDDEVWHILYGESLQAWHWTPTAVWVEVFISPGYQQSDKRLQVVLEQRDNPMHNGEAKLCIQYRNWQTDN